MGKGCKKTAEVALEGIRARAGAMRAQADAVRAEDPDGVHDMRVASRRLRAAVDEYRPALDKKASKALLKHVRAVTRTLGRPRELDVMLETLAKHRDTFKGEARTAANHALRRIRARRRAVAMSCREAAAIASGAQFEELLETLLASAAPSSECLLDHARRSLKKKFDRLCNAYKSWKETGNEERLHEVRIAFKKLRYACEVHARIYGDRMTRFLKRLKDVQQLLGDWNDLRVLRLELTDIAWELPDPMRAGLPTLIAAIGRPCAELETAFAAHAEQFFSKSRRRGARQLFQTPAISCPCCSPPKKEP